MTHKNKTQIIVIGAGYAGIMAALRLSGKTKGLGVEITLINGVDHFIQRPRLHQVATHQAVPQKPIAEMLRGHAINFVTGWVTAIQANQNAVRVNSARKTVELPYDYLIYALGSVVDRDSVPGVRNYAYTLDPRGPLSTEPLCQKLEQMVDTASRVVVVGGGPTGIEGAAEIKGLYPHLQVTLVTGGEFGIFKGERVARHLRQAFQQQEIEVVEQANVKQVDAETVVLADGRSLPADTIVWAGGFRALPLAQDAGITVNQRDQIEVDPYLQSLSHPNIYAVGDSAWTVEEPGVKLRMSLLTAVTMGAHAADNLSRRLKAKEQKPLSFAYYGQGIALGPNDAIGFNAFPTDKPVGPIFRGRLAVGIRAFFVWLILYILDVERRWPGFYFWMGKGRYAAVKRRLAKQQHLAPEIVK